MSDAFIISARRTPVSPIGGTLSRLSVWEMTQQPIKDCIDDAGISVTDIDEVYIGNGLYAGGNPARLISLAAGLPEEIPSLTIDTQCCSGMDAIIAGIKSIKSGSADIVIAGGAESYSRAPLRYSKPLNPTHSPIQYFRPPFSPFPVNDPEMAVAAADLAKMFGVTRELQANWAVNSHKKACEAVNDNKWKGEISELLSINHDEFTRRLTLATCSRAKCLAGEPLYAVDSATSAVSADGAAVVIIVSKNALNSINPNNFVLCGSIVQVGGGPSLPGLVPISAIQKALALEKIDSGMLWAIELMEAFASQAIVCANETGLTLDKVNIGGGALARGHPIGASGAILVVRLFHELKWAPSGSKGLSTIAGAGGLASALILSK